MLTPNTTLPVSATAYAEINSSAPACIIALSSSPATCGGGVSGGVSLCGGATLSAPNCAVASNSTVTTHATSNTVTTPAVDYNSSTSPSLSGSFQQIGRWHAAVQQSRYRGPAERQQRSHDGHEPVLAARHLISSDRGAKRTDGYVDRRNRDIKLQ